MGRMKEGDKNINFSWEVMKFMQKGSDFSREVLKFTKKGSQKTMCFGHGRRKMFVLRRVFERGFQKTCNVQ